jgi:hypothetical protein
MKKTKTIAAIILLCAAMLVYYWAWLKWNHAPPWGDGSRSFFEGARLFAAGNEGGWSAFFSQFNYISRERIYMPTVSLIYLILFKIFGVTEISVIVNWLFLCTGIMAVYGIAKRLFDNTCGLFSALVFASLPGIIMATKMTFREYNSMCMIVLAVYFLLRTASFRRTAPSIGFGIVAGLACLIRYDSLVFLLFPFTMGVIAAVKEKPCGSRAPVLRNIVLACSIAIAINIPWVFMHRAYLLDYYFGTRMDIPDQNKITLSLNNFGYYSSFLYNILLKKGYVACLAILPGILLIQGLVAKRMFGALKNYLYIFAAILIPLIGYHFLSVKDFSLILPILPFVGIAIGSGLYLLHNVVIRKCYMIVVFVLAVQALAFPITVAFHLEECPDYVRKNPLALMFKWGQFAEESKTGQRVVMDLCILMRARWDDSLKELVNIISEDYAAWAPADAKRAKPSVVLVHNVLPLRPLQLSYYNVLLGDEIYVVNLILGNFLPHEFIPYSAFDYYVIRKDADFALYSPEALQESARIIDFYNYITANREVFEEKYEKVRELQMPRDAVVIIYRRKQ